MKSWRLDTSFIWTWRTIPLFILWKMALNAECDSCSRQCYHHVLCRYAQQHECYCAASWFRMRNNFKRLYWWMKHRMHLLRTWPNNLQRYRASTLSLAIMFLIPNVNDVSIIERIYKPRHLLSSIPTFFSLATFTYYSWIPCSALTHKCLWILPSFMSLQLFHCLFWIEIFY